MNAPVEEPVVRVLAAVIQRQGRYLVCLRPRHKRHGGLWEFPGGKLESGETLPQAAARELVEELGAEPTGYGPLLFTHREAGSPFQIEFLAVEIPGEPTALEHDQLRWATVAELENLPLAPSDRAFVQEMIRPPPSAEGVPPTTRPLSQAAHRLALRFSASLFVLPRPVFLPLPPQRPVERAVRLPLLLGALVQTRHLSRPHAHPRPGFFGANK